MVKQLIRYVYFLIAACASASVSAEILTYTENTDSANQGSLGYPVPIPVASLTAVDGFRAYDELKAQHEALALANEQMRSIKTGDTLNGREILTYQFGDSDTTTFEGFTEPAFLINGTIHAREWQSPEVVTELIEQLIEQQDDQSFVEYLLDNTNIIIQPVMNIDGFLQTQRTPDQVTETPAFNLGEPGVGTDLTDPATKFAIPRDGRMRRKNMLNTVDEVLATEGDRLGGVDLNRNNEFFFGVQDDNDEPDSLIYGGPAAASEPESQALLAAAALGPANRLRFYVDAHSFSRVLFVPSPPNSRLNGITNSLATKFQNVTIGLGTNYFPVIGQVNQDIATTATNFAYRFEIPAWTLEIEPPGSGFPNTAAGGAFYGGTGISHSGFVMPDSAIARTRDQLTTAHLFSFYHQAGPPNVQSVQITDSGGNIVYNADWTPNGSGRTLQTGANQVLSGGTQYTVWIQFSKPMRVRSSGGSVIQYAGQNVPLAPALTLTGPSAAASGTFTRNIGASSSSWLNSDGGAPSGYVQYEDDALAVTFTMPSNISVSSETGNTQFTLQIDAQDFAGLSLDANPATVVDWADGAWTNYEDSSGTAGDVGGADTTISFRVANSTQIFVPDSGGGGGGSFAWLTLLLFALLFPVRRRYLRG
ncbi:MAG: hypothetical protein MJA83_01980 [Gammaproteobacteria bacterium]|nr:hypothetical protein [Gammaproteobacteria bacterium]